MVSVGARAGGVQPPDESRYDAPPVHNDPRMKWTADDIPDQSGKVAVVTGANSGLGLVTALELALHGAEVVVAARSSEKGEGAVKEIRAAPRGPPEPRAAVLDLASLDSVRSFAAGLA